MLLRGEVQGPSPRPLCAASCSDSDPAHPLTVTNGTSHDGLEGESHVGKYTADDTAGPVLGQSQSSADQALDALTSKRERSQAANPDNLLRVNAFYSPERTAKSSSARREEEEVERSAYDTVNVSNAHNSSSVMQQDKVRHWLEMERYRFVGPTIRSGEKNLNVFTECNPSFRSVTVSSECNAFSNSFSNSYLRFSKGIPRDNAW